LPYGQSACRTAHTRPTRLSSSASSTSTTPRAPRPTHAPPKPVPTTSHTLVCSSRESASSSSGPASPTCAASASAACVWRGAPKRRRCVPGPRCAYESGCSPVSRGRSVGLLEFKSGSFHLALTYIITFVQDTHGATPLSCPHPYLGARPVRHITSATRRTCTKRVRYVAWHLRRVRRASMRAAHRTAFAPRLTRLIQSSYPYERALTRSTRRKACAPHRMCCPRVRRVATRRSRSGPPTDTFCECAS
jgi:hypothetical protein